MVPWLKYTDRRFLRTIQQERKPYRGALSLSDSHNVTMPKTDKWSTMIPNISKLQAFICTCVCVHSSAHILPHMCPPPTSSNMHTYIHKNGGKKTNPYSSRMVPQGNTVGVTPMEVQGRAGRRPGGWSRAWCHMNIHQGHQQKWKRKKAFFSSVFRGSMTPLTTDRTSGTQDGKTTLYDVRPPCAVFCHRGPRMCNACFLCSEQSSGSGGGVHGLSRLPLLPT